MNITSVKLLEVYQTWVDSGLRYDGVGLDLFIYL